MSQTVQDLREERDKEQKPYILISGAQINKKNHCELYQADFQAITVFDTVKICLQLIYHNEKN
jgi:hypothetical protein